MKSDSSSRFADIRSELEEVRRNFLWLLNAIAEDDLDRRFPGEIWTAKQEMVHVVQVLELLPKGINRATAGGGRSVLSVIPTSIRNWVNGYIVIPLRSRRATRESVAEAHDRAWTVLIELLRELPKESWDRGAAYPQQYRTVEEMAHRPAEHFGQHAAHLCDVLGIRWKEPPALEGN